MYDIYTNKHREIHWLDGMETKRLTPAALQYMTLDELLEVCNTDPQHVAYAPTVAEQTDAAYMDADHRDWQDWMATRESDYPR